MKSIVIGVIGADVHAVGNRIIEYTLTREGYNVVNVGVLSSQEDFINAAIETSAHLIIVSSLYGHGELDCRGMRDKCNEAGLDNILLYVGGNIVVGKQDFSEIEERFNAFIDFLKLDLSKEGMMSARNIFEYGFDNSKQLNTPTSGQQVMKFEKDPE